MMGQMRVASLCLLLATTAVAGAGAQSASRPQRPISQAPIVEPRLTRLFGSDSLEMESPVLSPDGRWIAFSTYAAETSNLWVVPATGGEPVQLTTGRYGDNMPTFFPSGDRIAFRSDRPSSPGNPQQYVMVMPFDPQTGRAAGTPRQVSLESIAGQSLAVSPDGEWIAYGARSDTATRLMVVPSTGGTARKLAEFGGSVVWIQNLRWSRDGGFVYFSPRRRGTETASIMRAPVAGGRAEELGTMARRPLAIVPDRGLVLQRIDQGQGPGQVPVYEIVTFGGRAVARFATPRNMQLSKLTPDGRGLLASRSNLVAPIRVVPVAGGPARQLTEAREYDWPVGWSPDGAHVYVQTRANGHEGILRLPVDGGPATQWPIPAEAKQPFAISPDGRYFAYGLTEPAHSGDLRTLVVRRLADGQTRVVTRAAHVGSSAVTGPGGRYRNGAEFFYFELRGDRLELWSTPPEGPSRLLRAFPASYAGRTGIGVHGNRIAYTEKRGDSTAVFVAEGQNGRPHLLATIAGKADQPTWSHDGTWLAFDYNPPGEGSRYGVLLIGVGANGAVTAPPRVLEAGPQWGWQIEWLPDDRAFTVFGMTGQANQTHVFLVSLRDGERPVALTRDDPSTRWGYSLSPDGRYVAYPAEIPRGSSIWRVDLGDLLTGGRRTSR
ncbi:MAG: hypothetical protein A2083_08765 [Gemmatimonadetes bacterium GWC2_71_9]|nr:MAG: hypothetical protein A2083_08765 [Gemmatimonadetes bacterium GWC2_71_9]